MTRQAIVQAKAAPGRGVTFKHQERSREASLASLAPPAYAVDFVDRPAREVASAPASGSSLPAGLRRTVEALSGLDLADVRVHRGSARPAVLGAEAFTQGSEIHLGPGRDRHLAHEAWHAVQQKQGRVAATSRVRGVGLNADSGLEREADAMALLAERSATAPAPAAPPHGSHMSAPRSASAVANTNPATAPIQRKIRVGTKKYTFENAYDLNGNPFLVGGGGERVQLSPDQPGLHYESVANYEVQWSDANRQKIFHNLRLGRLQVIKASNSVGIYQPFKTYSFSQNTPYDIAYWPANAPEDEQRQGPKYKAFSTRLRRVVTNYENRKESKTAAAFDAQQSHVLQDVYSRLHPLIVAEEFRTQGAMDHFDKRWKALQAAVTNAKFDTEPSRHDNTVSSLKEAIKAVTEGLEFAGSGGKDAFRKKERGRRNGAHFVDRYRPSLLRTLSRVSLDGDWRRKPTVEETAGTIALPTTKPAGTKRKVEGQERKASAKKPRRK